MTKQVLLLFGGESSEHDISVSSARNVYAAIEFLQGARKVFTSRPVRVDKLSTSRPGVAPFSFEIPLNRLQPGEYISQVDVIDQLGQKFAFPRSSMVVLP